MNKSVHNLSSNQIPSYTSVVNNPPALKYLAFLGMLYLCIMLFNAILTNCYVGNNTTFVLGGTFTSPFVFLIDNIIAEIYGYKITRSIIFYSITAQTIFILLCQIIINVPHPEFFQNHNEYEKILGLSLLRIHLSGCIAYLLAILINTKILTQWKVLLKGRKFWLRSLGSNFISEGIYSLIAILLMEIQSIPLHQILKVLTISYSIKITYNIALMYPVQIIVELIRKKTKIDVYDFNNKFTPSKYYQLLQGYKNA